VYRLGYTFNHDEEQTVHYRTIRRRCNRINPTVICKRGRKQVAKKKNDYLEEMRALNKADFDKLVARLIEIQQESAADEASDAASEDVDDVESDN